MRNAWNSPVIFARRKSGICISYAVVKDCIILNGVWVWMFCYLKAGDS